MNAKPYAQELYSAYCAAVGGKAYNGQPLPSAQEFWDDPTKTAQAKAWEAVAEKAMKGKLPETEEARAALFKELLEDHVTLHGTELLEKYCPRLGGLAKLIAGVVAGALMAGLAALAATLSSCTTAVKQTSPDGSVTERVFALDAATARDLVKLYGMPQIPCVNVTK